MNEVERQVHAGSAWLSAMARRRPDALALLCCDEALSFGELERAARTIAAKLTSAAVGRGDRVALLLEPGRRFVEIYHALQMLGCVSVVLNGRASTSELQRQLSHCQPALLLFDHGRQRIAKSVCGPSEVVGCRMLDANQELDTLAPSGQPPERIELEALHSIVYTSGSSALPKAVMLTNANHAASARGVAQRLGLTPGDRWLAAMPLCHVGGQAILLRSVLSGFSVKLHPRFEVEAVHQELVSGDTTVVSLVPTMLARLVARAGASAERVYPPALRSAVVGGAALSGFLATRSRALGLPVMASYGLSETASQITTAGVDDDSGSCGLPLDGVALEITDADSDGWGEIRVCGEQVTPGYFRAEAMTSAAISEGWLSTGDCGRLDEVGRLHVACRRSDMIISGGENVSPLEVEAVLEDHEQVVEALVFGVDDDEWGQVVEATIVLRDGDDGLSDAQLTSWCRGFLSGYKVPRRFNRAAALPRTVTGKLLRAPR